MLTKTIESIVNILIMAQRNFYIAISIILAVITVFGAISLIYGIITGEINTNYL